MANTYPVAKGSYSKTNLQLTSTVTVIIGGLQPISRDTDNNAAMYNCWWTNKRS